MRLGFVGTGTITAAMVEGLFHHTNQIESVVLSPRNWSVASNLSLLDKRIRVARDNQDVLDRSDLVILAVRPQIVEEVLASLQFGERHRVISVVATLNLDRLRALLGRVDRITRALPLPFVAQNAGMTAHYPPDPVAHELFMPLGTSIEVETEAEFEMFTVASALMGTYFQLLHECNGWLAKSGMDEVKGRAYLASLFSGLSGAANNSPYKSFLALRDEFSTPGGINEQGAQIFRTEGGAQGIRNALDAIRWRVSAADRRNLSAD